MNRYGGLILLSGSLVCSLAAQSLSAATINQSPGVGNKNLIDSQTVSPVDNGRGSGKQIIEEVIVSAQRRQESLQDVPISIAAYSQEMIAERNITAMSDVALSTPGFVASQSFGQIAPTIRGIGADRFSMSSEPGVALYIDDIYLGRPYLPQATLSQIERIEVLKGPQGTLYGRNTSGGAVKVVTRRPTDYVEFSGALQAGNYDHKVAKASIAGPIVDALKARLSVYKEERDGYTFNAARNEWVDAHESESARLSIDWAAAHWLDVSLNADVNSQYDTGPVAYSVVPVTFSAASDLELTPALAPFDGILNPLLSLLEPGSDVLDPLTDALAENVGGRNSSSPRTVYQDAPTFTDIESQTVSLTLAAALGEIDVKLIAGYADSERDFPNDSDLTDLPGITLTTGNTTGEQFSLELQATSELSMPVGGALRWFAGAFYYTEDASEIYEFEVVSLLDLLGVDDPALNDFLQTAGELLPSQPLAILQNEGVGQIFFDAAQETESVAAFFDLEWDAASWMSLRLGSRFTKDTKRLLNRTVQNVDPRVGCEGESGEADFDATTLRAGADFPFADNRLVYVSYTEGFKAGGFSGLSCGDSAYAPEYVDAFEVGLKSQWMDGALQVNAAVFDYKFTDIQVEKVVGFATEVENAAEASIRGAEASVTYLPFSFLALDLGAAYLDATYGEFFDDDPYTIVDESEEDLSGNRLNKSPRWSGNVGAKVSHITRTGSEVSARVEWSYTDEMYYDQFNHDFALAEEYEVWNLFLSWDLPEHGLVFRGFGKNLTDEEYISGQFTASALVGSPYAYYGAPRTYGLEVEYRYGGL